MANGSGYTPPILYPSFAYPMSETDPPVIVRSDAEFAALQAAPVPITQTPLAVPLINPVAAPVAVAMPAKWTKVPTVAPRVVKK